MKNAFLKYLTMTVAVGFSLLAQDNRKPANPAPPAKATKSKAPATAAKPLTGWVDMKKAGFINSMTWAVNQGEFEAWLKSEEEDGHQYYLVTDAGQFRLRAAPGAKFVGGSLGNSPGQWNMVCNQSHSYRAYGKVNENEIVVDRLVHIEARESSSPSKK